MGGSHCWPCPYWMGCIVRLCNLQIKQLRYPDTQDQSRPIDDYQTLNALNTVLSPTTYCSRPFLFIALGAPFDHSKPAIGKRKQSACLARPAWLSNRKHSNKCFLFCYLQSFRICVDAFVTPFRKAQTGITSLSLRIR